MALADLMASFRGSDNSNQQPQQQQQATPGNIPQGTGAGTTATTTADANGVVPPASETENKETSPLDSFNDLWKDDPNKKEEALTGILGDIDPAKIAEVAKNVNFLKGLKKEDLEAVKAGGDDAIAALARALNGTAQSVYAQSAVATSKLIEQATSRFEEKMNSSLPDRIKALNFSNSLREDNPAYSHPAAAPLVSMIEQQFANKFPQATTTELKSMAQEYFTSTFSAISGADKKKADEASALESSGINWEQELGL